MPLAVTVVLLVTGVTALVAVAGYLIDIGVRREEKKQRKEGTQT
jgi:hypothetical protein